jgi:hypothetical protein
VKRSTGTIISLAVDYFPILDCSQDTGKIATENTFKEVVMDAVPALCEFSLLVRQQNQSDLSLKALDNAHKQLYKRKGNFRQRKLSKSVTASVDDLLARESNQLHELKIYKICAAMEALVYGA